MIASYSIIAPPFTLRFSEMSKQELKAYYEWYLAQIPVRIRILTNAVQATPGFEPWKPDMSRDSLGLLGKWFKERAEKKNGELTLKTFSIAVDVSMYMSQVFLKNFSNIHWMHLIKTSKNNMYYGQPVLDGFRCGPFNPVHMMAVSAYGFIDETYNEKHLQDIYDIWEKYLK